MCVKKRNSFLLGLLFGMAALICFQGITISQAREKAVLKIPKESKDVPEPTKKPVDVKKDVAVESKTKKEAEKQTYSYNPANKVDPFKSFIVVKKELEEEKEKERPRTYLETLDISQLTISAIISGSSGKWALVRDSKGDGHIIKIGTPIGTRRGRVTRILEKEVVVREHYTDIRGRKTLRDISMKLPAVE